MLLQNYIFAVENLEGVFSPNFQKNKTTELATYTMFTGEGNPYNLSTISSFNGNEHLSFWKNDQCNKVQGSDGATFNPYIQQVTYISNHNNFNALLTLYSYHMETLNIYCSKSLFFRSNLKLILYHSFSVRNALVFQRPALSVHASDILQICGVSHSAWL